MTTEFPVTPTLDLRQFIGRRVEVTRVALGQPGRFVGRFESLSHCTPEEMRRRPEPDAGGIFRLESGGGTGLSLPYGLSTIKILD